MNLPNILTLSRIVLAIVLVWLLEKNTASGNVYALIVFIAASITDFYDGHLAKKYGLISDFGKIMDPIADKILLLTTFGVLAHIGMIAWWMFGVIAAREILVTASRLGAMRQGHVLAADRAGKLKTVTQIVAVSFMLLYLVAQSEGLTWFTSIQHPWIAANYWLMILAVGMTVYSGIDYYYSKSKQGDN